MPEPDTPLAERPWEDVDRMVTVETALARVLAAFAPLPAARVPLLDALGLVLAEDVVAGVDVPPFRNSAMDGYAVRAVDTAGATDRDPVVLRLVGDLAAGAAPGDALAPGTAIRIMTGAAMPDGADAVVRFEETDETAYGPERAARAPRSTIGIRRPAKPWDNVRPAGEDIRRGKIALRRGCLLRPPELGLLASLNAVEVAVHRRPVVAILSTGDEVVDPGADLQPGQIRNSNSFTLAAMVKRFGGVPLMLGIARDRLDDLQERLAAGRHADLIVSSGGVSLGDYDMVKDVLHRQGQIEIWQVRMKPGKPLAFGTIGGTPILGLPGNPVAAAVSFEVFGRPAMMTMLGRSEHRAPTIQATLTERLDNRGQRRHFVRARAEQGDDGSWTVRTAGEQGAGVLTSLVAANGLLVVPEELERVEPGAVLTVRMLDWNLE